jgi:S-methylmethionine-dependent homocysteine/selenocysteine methylase
MRMGAPFRQPEWSALALLEAPGLVEHAHRAFAAAGADVLTTSTYAIVPFHLGDGLFRARAADLAVEAGRRARSAADAAGRRVLVAGSLPPLFGSYRPDLFDADEAPGLLEPPIRGLMNHVDLWLCETASSIAEVEAALSALAGDRRPAWVSYTLADDPGMAPMLRSGEPIPLAVAKATQLGASAVLFNCSPPEVMAAALREALPVAEACGARRGCTRTPSRRRVATIMRTRCSTSSVAISIRPPTSSSHANGSRSARASWVAAAGSAPSTSPCSLPRR